MLTLDRQDEIVTPDPWRFESDSEPPDNTPAYEDGYSNDDHDGSKSGWSASDDTGDDYSGQDDGYGNYSDFWDYDYGSGEGRTRKKRKKKELADAPDEGGSDSGVNAEASEIYGGCIPRPRLYLGDLDSCVVTNMAAVIEQEGVQASVTSTQVLRFVRAFIYSGG